MPSTASRPSGVTNPHARSSPSSSSVATGGKTTAEKSNGTPNRPKRCSDTASPATAAPSAPTSKATKANIKPQTNGRTPPAKPRSASASRTGPARNGSSPLLRAPLRKDGALASSPDGRLSSKSSLDSPSKQIWEEIHYRKKWATPAQRPSSTRNGTSPRAGLRSSMVNFSPPSGDLAGHVLRRRLSLDSPSKQLWEEFSRMVLDSDHEFQHKLEESSACQRQQHHEALQLAVEKHEYVRKSAENAKRRAEAEDEIERKRVEDEEMEALRRLEQAAHEAELRRQQERKDAEAQRIAREAERKKKEQEAKEDLERIEREAQRAHAERQKREREAQQAREDELEKASRTDAERRAKEAVEAAEKAAATSAPQANVVAPPGINVQAARTRDGKVSETEHKRYLQIHKDLKALRKACRNEPTLKTRMGDLRRQITKSLGQLTLGKSAGVNKQPTDNLRIALRQALSVTTPTVDIRKYLATPPPNVAEGDSQVSMLFVYCINIFSKGFFTQLASEAGVSLKNADPIGRLAVAIFAAPDFQWRGLTLIDVLLAKFHKVCPVLWGVYGNEKKEHGRERIGWSKQDGEWVSAQLHNERMTGFGAGFAALALRDFSKVSLTNPFPPKHYWTALARIVNTPAADAQPTHFLVLKSMVECGAEKFIGFYGKAAIVLLRKGLVDFPAQAPKSVAATAVSVLPEVLARDLKVYV